MIVSYLVWIVCGALQSAHTRAGHVTNVGLFNAGNDVINNSLYIHKAPSYRVLTRRFFIVWPIDTKQWLYLLIPSKISLLDVYLIVRSRAQNTAGNIQSVRTNDSSYIFHSFIVSSIATDSNCRHKQTDPCFIHWYVFMYYSK